MSETSQDRGIDAQGLTRLADAAQSDPSTGHKVVRVRSVWESGFRNQNYVRSHAPVLVSEPHQLLGDDEAPNPTEMALSALGSCINVGLLANATHRGVTLTTIEVELEGDIDISAVWGVGDLAPDKALGITDVRVNVTLAGDADEQTLQQITDQAIAWSPVVNTFTRPVGLTASLTVA